MTTPGRQERSHPAGPGPDCRPILRPRRAGSPPTCRHHRDRRLTFAQLRDEVRTAAAAMIDLGVGAGDRVAIWSPNTWHWVVACLATHYAGGVRRPAQHPLHRQRGRRRAGPHRGAAAGRVRRVPRRRQDRRPGSRLPCRTCGTSCASRSTRTTGPGTSSSPAAPTSTRSTPARPRSGPTTSPTSCSPPAPPAAARARCARTGSRSTRPRRGRRAGRSPAPTATSASTRSSTTSATRRASWPACRPGRR